MAATIFSTQLDESDSIPNYDFAFGNDDQTWFNSDPQLQLQSQINPLLPTTSTFDPNLFLLDSHQAATATGSLWELPPDSWPSNPFFQLDQLDPTISASSSSSSSNPPTVPPSEAPVEAEEGFEDLPKKLRSCAACRLRRVKCVREQGNDDCVNCKSKKLQCKPMPIVPRKPAVRSGKRLDQARALFGNDDDGQPQRKRLRGEETDPHLSTNGVVARLVTSELEGALSASLLELYTLLPHSRLPLLRGVDFRLKFESSGRRLSSLDQKSSVLYSLIFALAARVSDHPLLVGSNIPTDEEMLDGRDLSEFGRIRNAACEALSKKAVEMGDKEGIWREPDVENVASLMVLEMMEEVDKEEKGRGRFYSDAYLEQIREMLEGADQDKKQRMRGSGMGWTAYMRDAIFSATQGKIPRFRDEDIILMSATERPPLPLQDALLTPSLDSTAYINAYQGPFLTLFHSLMAFIASTARPISDRLTSIRATKNKRIEEEFVRELIMKLDFAKEAQEEVDRRALRFLGPYESAGDAEKGEYGFVRIVSVTRAWLVLLVYIIVDRRIRGQSSSLGPSVADNFGMGPLPPIPGPSEGDEEYWTRLRTLHRELKGRAWEASREVIATLQPKVVSRMAFGIMSGSQVMFSRLSQWIGVYIDQPVFEEGGPVGFDFATKIRELRGVLATLHNVGWAFEKLSRPTPWIKHEIEVLEKRQSLYWSRVGQSTVREYTNEEVNRILGDMGISTGNGTVVVKSKDDEASTVVKMFTAIFT